MSTADPKEDLFARFEESVQSHSITWIDDYDLQALSRLKGPLRERARKLIDTQLERGDGRAARALAEMGESDAIPVLRKELEQADGIYLAELVMSLKKLGAEGDCLDHLFKVLDEPWEESRNYAAYCLREFSGPGVIAALMRRAERDPDRDVRTTAATSLLLVTAAVASPFDQRLRPILMLLDSENIASRQQGMEALREFIAPERIADT